MQWYFLRSIWSIFINNHKKTILYNFMNTSIKGLQILYVYKTVVPNENVGVSIILESISSI